MAFVLAVIPFVSFVAWLPALAAIVLGIIGLIVKNRKRLFAALGLGIGVLAIIVGIGVSVASIAGVASSVGESIEETSIAQPEPAEEVEHPVEPEPTEEVVEPEAPAVEEPQFSLSQSNALGQAENYLAYTSFSRTGLIEQLEYEGFDNADATFAVDQLQVDWNAQAALKAQEYLDYTSFSRQGLIDQLVYEGFSADEANFGATAVGY